MEWGYFRDKGGLGNESIIIMTEGRILCALRVFALLSHLVLPFTGNITTCETNLFWSPRMTKPFYKIASLRLPIVKHFKHGALAVVLPFDSHVPLPAFFAICCDISLNPGHDYGSVETRSYSRTELLDIGKSLSCTKSRFQVDSASLINLNCNGVFRNPPWDVNAAFTGARQTCNRIATRISSASRFNTRFNGNTANFGNLVLLSTNNSSLHKFSLSASDSSMHKFSNKIRLNKGRHIPVWTTSRHDEQWIKNTHNARNLLNLININTTKNSTVPRLRFAFWNIRSMNRKKVGTICDLVVSKRLDILALNETWMQEHGANSDPALASVINTLQDFDFIQTPRSTLDLVITREGDQLISDIPEIIRCDVISDHSAIVCTADIARPKATKKTIMHRDLRRLDTSLLCDDIKDSILCSSELGFCSDVNTLVEQYNDVLGQLIDKHAPVRSCTVTLRPHMPWFSENLRSLKRQRRQAERRYVASGLEVHRQMYADQCRLYTDALNTAKQNYYRDMITDSDQTQLFHAIDGLFKVKFTPPLPSHDCPQLLAEEFADFFTRKIQVLKDQMSTSNLASMELSVGLPPSVCKGTFSVFSDVPECYIREVIQKSKSRYCILDPVPTKVLKNSIDTLAPVLTSIVNLSLKSGVFPTSLKKGVILPSIKKQSSNREEFASYRNYISLLTHLWIVQHS